MLETPATPMLLVGISREQGGMEGWRESRQAQFSMAMETVQATATGLYDREKSVLVDGTHANTLRIPNASVPRKFQHQICPDIPAAQKTLRPAARKGSGEARTGY